MIFRLLYIFDRKTQFDTKTQLDFIRILSNIIKISNRLITSHTRYYGPRGQEFKNVFKSNLKVWPSQGFSPTFYFTHFRFKFDLIFSQGYKLGFDSKN